jgi:anti-anti-sigma factor
MDIQTQRQGAVIIVRPEGAIATADADQLKQTLLEQSTASLGRVVLNLEAVPFVDSRALEVFVDVTEHLGAGGQVLKLCGVNKTVREVLELTELAPLFELYEDAGGAARSFL